MYGREQALLTEFESESADPFKVLTPLIFHGQYSEDLRHKTKNCFVYPSLYGAGLQKVALQLGVGKEEAAPLYNRYKESIPGITAISEQVRELVKQRGWVRYWDGRRRHIRNRSEVHTRAWNSVLQGGASQLVKRAMLTIESEIEDENCFMVLQVHDEITFCIRRDLLDHYSKLIVHAMTDFPQFGVRFAVEGKEWGVKSE
jgi:DNA polymerase-1